MSRAAIYAAAVADIWAGQQDGAHDLGHLHRVWANAQTIAAGESGADLEVLEAAAYFHDAVNLPKNSPDRARASTLSADLARQVLPGLGFPVAKLEAVAHAIAAHSFSANIPAETLEARILQDADRLEALGAIGLARLYHIGGQMGGGLFHPDDPLALNRPLDDKAHALDHLEVKLFPLVARMQTATGRAMAETRAERLRRHRADLLEEAGFTADGRRKG